MSHKIIFQISLICLIFATFLVHSSVAGFICPPSKEIKPCKCGIYRESATEENGYIICHGQEVTQESIKRVFGALLRVNELSPVDWTTLSYFRLAETKLTTLDLSPLLLTRAKLVTLYNNTELFQITPTPSTRNPVEVEVENSNSTSPLQNEQEEIRGLIQVEDLVIGQSPINSTTFENGWLRHFSTEHLKKFTVGNTHLNQVPGDLSAFTKLETLEFWNSRIQRMDSGGLFKKMGNLTELRFTGNELEYIGENAFEFDGDWNNSNSNSQIKISLDSNKNLTESSFHPNWAGSLSSKMEEYQDGNMTLTRTLKKRPIYLDLSWTNFTTLPSETFQGFLDSHPQNELNLFGAPLKCDNRVAWLQNKTAGYEKQVHVFQTCNDGGSIFTSDLKE